MLLSMIVVITSCAPVRALSSPAIPPNIAPPIAPAATASGTCNQPGPSNAKPTHNEVIPPANIWPVAPMLNNPPLNAIDTARPLSRSGVVPAIVFEIERTPQNDP